MIEKNGPKKPDDGELDRFLRLSEVEALVGLGRSTIYQMVSNGGFPPPYKLGRRAVGWKQSDIALSIDSRPPTRCF